MQVNDYLYKNFEMRFPGIAQRVTDMRKGAAFEILMTLDDSTKMSYDDLDETIRKLPGDGSDMTIEECAIEFGIRLNRIMKIQGVSQLELSEATGITQPSISNYISGKIMPSFYSAVKIARYLDCNVEDFTYKY